MRIIEIARQVPSYIYHKAVAIKSHITTLSVKILSDLASYLRTGCRPLIDRYIKPLNQTDYFILGCAVFGSGLLMTVVLRRLGIGALPLVAGGVCTLIGGAGKFSSYRTKKHFDDTAWNTINQIRLEALKATQDSPPDIASLRGTLNKYQFEHLKKDLKQLDKKIDKFNKGLDKPLKLDKRKQAFTTYLSDLQKKIIPGKTIT